MAFTAWVTQAAAPLPSQFNGKAFIGEKIDPPNTFAGTYFGASVAASNGNRLLVGSVYNQTLQLPGAAAMMMRRGNAWELEATLTPDPNDSAPDDIFGGAVALSPNGTCALVGAPGDNDLGENSGSAWFFCEDENEDWRLIQKLLPSQGVQSGLFGNSVALFSVTEKTFAVVGAPLEHGNVSQSGALYMYELDNGELKEIQRLVAENGNSGSFLALSVTVAPDGTIFAGAPFEDVVRSDETFTNSGAIHVFSYQEGTSWEERTPMIPNELEANTQFGRSVSISPSGETMLIGAHSGYIFRQENGEWVEQQKMSTLDIPRFGFSGAVHGDLAILGTLADDPSDLSPGTVYVFIRNEHGWELFQTLSSNEQGEGNLWFGISSAILFTQEGKSVVFVGSPRENNKSGSLYAYVLKECGDQDDNGVVNIFDVIMALRIIVGQITPTETQRILADLNNNGAIDIFDVVVMLQHIAGQRVITRC